jgi:hypothetical protein
MSAWRDRITAMVHSAPKIIVPAVLLALLTAAMPALAQDRQPLGTDPRTGGPTPESVERGEEIARRLQELRQRAEEERRAREEQRSLEDLMRREQQGR